MILRPDEKIHVIHRRLFSEEARRHFIGTVEGYEDGIIRSSGHLFTVDRAKFSYVKHPEKRTHLISVASGDVLVNIIPPEIDLEKIEYKTKGKFVTVTDGEKWCMELSEVARE